LLFLNVVKLAIQNMYNVHNQRLNSSESKRNIYKYHNNQLTKKPSNKWFRLGLQSK